MARARPTKLDSVEPAATGMPLDEHQAAMLQGDRLTSWWMDDAHDTAHRTIAKMVEYGSGDLVALGNSIRRMSGQPPLTPVEAMELGCLTYLLGKVHRAVEAITAGRPIKDDTWFDAEVYAKMARAARAGVWVVAAEAET